VIRTAPAFGAPRDSSAGVRVWPDRVRGGYIDGAVTISI
jgi:hypothetical protein